MRSRRRTAGGISRRAALRLAGIALTRGLAAPRRLLAQKTRVHRLGLLSSNTPSGEDTEVVAHELLPNSPRRCIAAGARRPRLCAGREPHDRVPGCAEARPARGV